MIPSTWTYDEAAGVMTIEFKEADLVEYQSDKLADFRGHSTYNIENRLVFTDELQSAFQTSNPIIINPGEYPLTYRNGAYLITINL